MGFCSSCDYATTTKNISKWYLAFGKIIFDISYYFGDIGEDQTNGDGKVWVSIDYLFGQTVNTTVPYQVFVTPYSSAHVWVSKRLKNRFLVESDKPSASFAWEIKAKRKGYEHTRLKNVDNMMEKPAGVK